MRASPSDFERGLPEPERSQLSRVAARVVELRPSPPAGLRVRVMAALPPGEPIARPRRLWPRIALFATVGAALLLLIAAGVAGSGPFAP